MEEAFVSRPVCEFSGDWGVGHEIPQSLNEGYRCFQRRRVHFSQAQDPALAAFWSLDAKLY